MSPFAGYDDLDACVRDNADKDDAEAYCAAIKREIEGGKSLTDAQLEALARDGCPDGKVNINGTCVDVTEVDDVPPSALDMGESRILSHRRLAGPIERAEEGDQVRYSNIKILSRGVWRDANSGQPLEYVPENLTVEDGATVNVMHDIDNEVSAVGEIDAESAHVDDGDLYADIVLHMENAASEWADENLQATLESDGQKGFGGPSVEIPAGGQDVDPNGDLGYPAIADGVIDGLALVGEPAAKTTAFAQQTAERAVALSSGQEAKSVWLKDGDMSQEIAAADALDAFGVDADELELGEDRELADVPVAELVGLIAESYGADPSELMDALSPFIDGDGEERDAQEDEDEEGDENEGEGGDGEDEEGEEGEDGEDDVDVDIEAVASAVDDLQSRLQTLEEEYEALMEAETVEAELSQATEDLRDDLADADTVEDLDKRLSQLTEEINETLDAKGRTLGETNSDVDIDYENTSDGVTYDKASGSTSF